MILHLVLLSAVAACPAGSLRTQIQKIASEAQGRVGVAATILETGEQVSFHGGERFPMQSVYKLPIGMAVLDQVDHGVLSLEGKVRVEVGDLVPPGLHSPIRDEHPEGIQLSIRELLRFMVAESDGTASDVLLRLAGGPPRVTKYLRDIGVNGMVVATSEMEMSRSDDVQYRNWATPEASVTLLRAVHQPLLLEFMTQTGTGPHRIKGLLPASTNVAHKTGTSGTHDGLTRATNDIGLVTLPNGRHMAIAVFVSDSKAEEAARDGVIAKVTQAAWDCWGGQQ
jgi:beta-lactamase class A